MTTLLKIKEALKDSDYSTLESELDLQCLDCTYDKADADEIDLNEFQEQAQDYIDQSVQVIYYATAIDYLVKNDPSLYNSLEIARECGFEIQSINSELLATLLVQRECCDELQQLLNELEG